MLPKNVALFLLHKTFSKLSILFLGVYTELEEYFHTCDITSSEEELLLEDCEYAEQQQELEEIVIILRLQAVLQRLITKNMSNTANNKLVKAVKKKHAEKVKNHWFTEYLEHYHS